MRVLLIFLALTLTHLWSADYQKVTFSDGKILVGYLDEKKGILTLDDGSTIAISVDSIVRREPMIPGKKPLNIPPPVKSPSEATPSEKAKELPTKRTELMTLMLIQSMENVHQARRRWLDVQRKISGQSSGQSSGLPATLTEKLAIAQADLDEATAIARQVNLALQAQLMVRSTQP